MIPRRGLLGLGAAALVGACSSPVEDTPAATTHDDSQFNGTYFETGPQLPDVSLSDQHGEPFNLRTDLAGQVVALFFGYTNCPDVCPGIMADMAAARRRMEEDLAEKVKLVVVTTDPARDTAEALEQYLSRVDPDFIGLTGPLEDIMAAGQELGISISEGKQLESGGYEVDHSTQILGFGSHGELSVVWSQPSVADIRDDLSLLAASD